MANNQPGIGILAPVGSTPANLGWKILSMGSLSPSLVAADWASRSTGPNVVWAHNWDSLAEVRAFQVAGDQTNDPSGTYRPSQFSTLTWDQTDHLSGSGCMMITNPSGSIEAGNWARPFSPLSSGSGIGSNPACNGSLAKFPWAPVSGQLQTGRWTNGGYFAPQDIGQNFPTNWWLGQRFILQMRVKMDPRCTHPSIREVGKVCWFSLTASTSNASQMVVHSKGTGPGPFGGVVGGPNYFNIYGTGSGGTDPIPFNSGGDHKGQFNSDLGTPYCDYGNGIVQHCWSWSGGWDTILMDLIVGHDGQADTSMKIYAANQGVYSYTKIWDQPNFVKNYEQPAGTGTEQFSSQYVRPGINAWIPGYYVNKFEYSYSTTTDAWHKYGEAILARAPDLVTDARTIIPCPQYP